jgi:hypothetical protein
MRFITVTYFIGFCALPRARDCGLPLWTILLFLIPVANAIPTIALFFSRTRLPVVIDSEVEVT